VKLNDFLERLNGLKNIPRTGWLLCDIPIVEVEDVAQHTFDVAAITFLLADSLQREGRKIDVERALSMAIIHDWAEASLGDFPYTALKHLGPAGTKRDIEERALQEILAGMANGEKYIQLWREYSSKKTPEAMLVHAADYLSMLVQAVKYRERGHSSRGLEELWDAVEKDLSPYAQEFPVLRELVAGLRKRFRRG
jgi:putative hydrolase of HD superfamily